MGLETLTLLAFMSQQPQEQQEEEDLELQKVVDQLTNDPESRAPISYVKSIAESGKSPYNWNLLKQVVLRVFRDALSDWSVDAKSGKLPSQIGGEDSKEWIRRIEEAILAFSRPPWTLQRICEILLNSDMCRSAEVFVISMHRLLCGIRERAFKNGEFGLTCEDESSDSKHAFQLPFYNAPRLRAVVDQQQITRSNTAYDSSKISEAIARGFASVHPSILQ
jgi:hypothetical protein